MKYQKSEVYELTIAITAFQNVASKGIQFPLRESVIIHVNETIAAYEDWE